MATTIQLRRDIAANWTSNNPVLHQGEIGLETDSGRLKIGDGSTPWTSLGYFSSGGDDAVTSVNTQTGAVVLTAADVSADASGAASAAQTAAESFATSAVATETTRAEAAEALKAPLASPAFTGTPTAPTASALTNTTQIATTAYADAAVAVETSRAETSEAEKLPVAGGSLTGHIAPALVTLTDAATISIDASRGNVFAVTLGGDRTLANPSNPVDGQAIRVRVIQDSTGSRTLAFSSAYAFGNAGVPTLSTAGGAVDILGFEYVSDIVKWCYLGAALNFTT